jgi:hypothetical protein
MRIKSQLTDRLLLYSARPLIKKSTCPYKIPTILLSISLLMVSCSYYSPIYWGCKEWVGTDAAGLRNESIATLDWSKHPGVIGLIDETALGKDYKKAKISPGRHVIEYSYYPSEFGAHPKGKIEIDLKAGHVYEFHIKLCFWCKPIKFAVWVDDNTTGESVWGAHPDWPSWYL